MSNLHHQLHARALSLYYRVCQTKLHTGFIAIT